MAAEFPVGLHHGDIIQLYCPGEMGYVYGKPGLNTLTIDFHDKSVSKPLDFPLFNFSTFRVILKTEAKVKSKGRITYGSAVYLQHQASDKYLALTEDKKGVNLKDNGSPFKIIPPNRLGWGKELRNNNDIKLESEGLMIEFSHKNQYCPTLAADDGTVFSVRVYCQNHNPKTIKGSSVLILGSCLKIEGFLCASGSFVNETLKQFQRITNDSSYEICEQIGLLKLLPGSHFKRLPYYGDAFFQLEKIDPKVDLHGDSFTYNEYCRIKHLFSLKYISVDESEKIILQDSANDSSKFKILPVYSPLSQNEVSETDEIIFWHVNTKKYLIIDVKPASNRKNTFHLSWFNLDLSDDLSMSKSQFKVSQVTNEALLDVYKAIGSTFSLCECLIKLLKIAPSKSNAHKEAVSIKVLESFHQLNKCFESTQSKNERLVNMLQFLKAFDIIIALLEILKQDLDNFQKCCKKIFSVLTVCVNNGTLGSAFSLVEGKIITVKGMVGKEIDAEELLIALYKKNIDFMSTLDFDQVEDSELLFTLAFKRRINWHIQKKICENESKRRQPRESDKVKEILDIFVQAVGTLQEIGIASRSSRMFFTDQKLEDSVSFYHQQLPNTAAMKNLHELLSAYKEKGPHDITLLLNVLVFYVDYETYSEANKLIEVLLELLKNSKNFEFKIASRIKILVLLCLRLLFKRHISKSLWLSIMELPQQKDTAINIDSSATTETSFTNKIELKKVEKLLKEKLNTLKIFFVKEKHEDICKNLLDLIIENTDEDVCLMSIELLFEIHNAERTLLSEAINSCFDTDKSTEHTTDSDEMRQLADGKQLLSKLASRTIDKKLQETLCKKIDELPKSCKSDLLYRCGLFDDVLEFVLESADLQVHDKSNEIEILESCFKLLISVTRQNKKAQDKIFIYWPSLLKMNPIGSAILLINEVFYNNSDLCNKLTVLDIESIFLTAISSETTEHYQLSVVLKTIIKNSNPSVIVKDLIACLILEHSADTLKFKLGSPSRHLDSQSDGNDPLLLCITELLVSCTEDGECQYAKSVACQVLHPVKLFVAIKDKELKPEQKLIFHQLYKAVCHEDFSLATGRIADTDIEKFRKFLEELEEGSTTALPSVHVQEEDEQSQAKLLRNYILEPAEEIEDAISKKGTFNDFFDKQFKPEVKSCEVLKLLSTLVKERSHYHCCFEELKLDGMILKTLQFLTAKFKKDDKFKREYITEMLSDKVSLFDLLNHQNFEIICEVLVCLNFCGKGEDFQAKIIELVTKNDYSLIIRVHQLLRQVEFVFNKAKIKLTKNVTQQKRKLHVYIEAALDVISLLCDRQQKEMQDAMRENKSFYGSGIVCQVALLLSDTANSMIEEQQEQEAEEQQERKPKKQQKHKPKESIVATRAQKSAQALIEMCTGNYKNQEIAFKSQVIVSINVILKNLNKEEQSKLSLINLKSSCIELLEIMLEEIDENSPQLASWIANYLEEEHLIEVMQKSFKRLTSLKTADEEKSKSRILLFRAYHVLRRFKDYGIYDDSDKKKEDDAMWSYCEHRSRSVEIIYEPKEGKEILSRAYFPYRPGHHHIKDKESILLHIKRSTPQEKLLDLLKWAKAVERTNKQKNEYQCVQKTLLRSAPARHYILLLLTYILNLLILTIKTPPDYNMQVTNNEFCIKNDIVGTYNETCNSTKNAIYFQPIWIPEIPFWSSITISILGIIHAILAILMVTDYFYRNWKPRCGTIYLCQNLWYKTAKWLLRKDCTYRCLSKCLSHKPRETQPIEYFQIIFESFQPFYRITFMVCSMFAWIPYPASLRYLYCICMIYPFLRIDVMQYILKAVKTSFIQLAVVFLLCFVLMYIYAVISFGFLNNYLSKEKDQFCGNILQCFFTVSRLGLLDTLGSEFDIRPSDEYEPNFTLYAFRTVYDIIFFIVITTLALNIIIAILVDRFSKMRQTQDTVDEDDASKCFICGIERSEFDKRNKDFKKHVNEEHNMWNYIRYIIYLKNLLENDHNAVEKHVSDKICDDTDKPQSEGQKPCDFFPLFRAKALPDYKPSEVDSEEKLHQLITKTKELEKALDQVKKEVEKTK